MTRLITALLVVAFFAFSVSDVRVGHAQEVDASPTIIRFATLAPAGSIVMRALDAWNRELRRRTQGSVSFRFYPSGVQGDEPDVIRKIRTGRLDAGTISATGLGLIHRPALVFQLPGTFREYAQLEAARQALGPEIERGMISAGFRTLGWADIGRARLFSTHPIRRPSDLATRRVWLRADDLVMPAFFEVVRTNAVTTSIPEVLSAMQTGRVDTFIAPPAVVVALQWGAHVTHMTDIPMSIIVGATVISDSVFTSLSEDEQRILMETAAQVHALGRRNTERAETQSLEGLASHGLVTVTTTAEERAEWARVGAEVRTRVAARIASPELIQRAAAFGGQAPTP